MSSYSSGPSRPAICQSAARPTVVLKSSTSVRFEALRQHSHSTDTWKTEGFWHLNPLALTFSSFWGVHAWSWRPFYQWIPSCHFCFDSSRFPRLTLLNLRHFASSSLLMHHQASICWCRRLLLSGLRTQQWPAWAQHPWTQLLICSEIKSDSAFQWSHCSLGFHSFPWSWEQIRLVKSALILALLDSIQIIDSFQRRSQSPIS